MIALRILAALAAATLLELLGVRITPHFVRLVDPFIVVVVWYALRTDTITGQLTGTVAGMVQDGLVGGLFGLHAIANTVVGYVVGRQRAGQPFVDGSRVLRLQRRPGQGAGRAAPPRCDARDLLERFAHGAPRAGAESFQVCVNGMRSRHDGRATSHLR